MNNFKNAVIVILSLIILVQAAFLISLLSRREQVRPRKVVKRATLVVPREVTRPAVKPPAPAAVPSEPAVKPIKGPAKIAIVLDDWGYNLKNRKFITDNDFRVTVSVLPFKTFSTTIAQLAYHKNKDIIIHMPMEPRNKENYGLEEQTLLTTMDKRTLVRLLRDAEASVPYAKGLSNHMGSAATEDIVLMKTVMEYLKKRNLFFLDSLVTPRTVCKDTAEKLRVGFAARDVFIDNESDPVYIREQMLKLAKEAQRKGVAIGIGHDRPNTISVLNEVIPVLQAQGYQFINLSEAIKESH